LNQVKLELGTILALLTPPNDVASVDDYRRYIHDLLGGVQDPQPKRKPGRPLKYGHPYYSDDEYRHICKKVVEQIDKYPEHWTNDKGVVAKKAAQDQTGVPRGYVLLDNGWWAYVEIPEMPHITERIPDEVEY